MTPPSENERISESLSKYIHALFGKSKDYKNGNPTGGLVALSIQEALEAKDALLAPKPQKDDEVERLEEALRLIAYPELQDKYTSQQIALHALRVEPLQP